MTKKNYTKKVAIYFAFIVAISFATFSANAQIVWDQGSLTFTKTSPGQTDDITAFTHLTRGSTGALYNAVYESSQTYGSCFYNPTNTEWAYGNISDWNTLTYQDLFCLNNRFPPSMVNQPMVVHLIQENIYLQLTFTYWQSGGGGGNFTYTRTTTGCGSESLTNITICQGQSYTFNGISYNTSGTYTKALTNAAGCDSFARLKLTVNAIPFTQIQGATSACSNVQLQASTFVPGIKYNYYNNYSYTTLSQINSLTPANTGIATKCEIDMQSRDENYFAFKYYGKILIPTAGTYTFYTTSDDGSNILIDGALVVSNDYLQPPTERSGQVTLTAGYHDFEANFFEYDGGEWMQAHIEGPGINKTELTSSNYLFYSGTASYNWSGGNNSTAAINTFTNSGSYSLTTTGSNGCSSVNNFNVSINSSRSLTNLTINSNQLPYIWNGLTFTTAGIQTKSGFTNSLGCDSSATLDLRVNSVLSVSGPSSVCVGSTIAMNASSPGGVWSILGRGTINASGIVTGTSAGATIVKYTLAGISATKNITVYSQPITPSIAYQSGTTGVTGSGGVCKNKTFTLVGIPAGGSWSSTGAISINSSGVVTTTNVLGACSVTYTYTNSNSCSSSRTVVNTVISCGSRGTNQVYVADNQFSVYPNPARSVINLNVKTLVGKGTMVLTDLYGKQLKQQPLSIGANTIDVSNVAKGMYLVSIITEQGKQTEKIILE